MIYVVLAGIKQEEHSKFIELADDTSYSSIVTRKVENPIHDAKITKSPDELIPINEEFMKGIEGSFCVFTSKMYHLY